MANNAFVNVFRIKELRDRILFTIGILVVFRLGSVLTIPGIDPHALSAYFQSQVRGNAFVDYMDFFCRRGIFQFFCIYAWGDAVYFNPDFDAACVVCISEFKEDCRRRRR